MKGKKMPNKFYAVKNGKIPGIYKSWNECKEQVEGFSGAVYKSFKTLNEANDFINADNPAKKSNPDSSDPFNESVSYAIAYVDGSYNATTCEFSYGVVFFYKGKEYHLSEKVNKPELSSMRNVAGEIKGSEAAIKMAIELNCPKIVIYHDYEGIARWCLGDWQTKKEGTKSYKAFYDEAIKKIEIEFIKVKGHSNNKYNDLADSLAKQAIFQ